MNDIFWFGQIFWLTFLVIGVCLSLAYAHLADEESAKSVSPDNARPSAARSQTGSTGFNVSQGSNA